MSQERGDPASNRGGEGRLLHTTCGTLVVPGPRASDGMGWPGTEDANEETF